MKKNITVRLVKSLKPAEKPYEVLDTDLKGFLLRVQPTGKMTYYFSYRLPSGKRLRYKIGVYGTITAVQARDAAKVLAGKVALNIDIQDEKKEERKRAESEKLSTLRGFIDERYESWVTTERKTGKAAIRQIRFNFGDLMDLPLTEINLWLIDKWRAAESKRGKKNSSINRDCSSLQSALSKAVEWGVISEHPLRGLKPKKLDGRALVRYLSKDEDVRLRKALMQRETRIRTERASANKWRRERGRPELPMLTNVEFADYLRPMVILALNTGLRRGEIFALAWSKVNFSTKILTVVGPKAKSGKTRHIPMNDEVINILKAWQKQTSETGLVFPGKNGKPMDNVNRSWKGALDIARIEKFRFHDLRHTFASKLVMAGVDLNTVRELMGHASIEMTLRYAHLAPEHKAEAVAKLMAG